MNHKLTERQTAKWPGIVEQLRSYGVDVSDVAFGHSWVVEYYEEVRPGRGHDINAFYCDGEHFAQVQLDVYGRATVSIGELDWIHADSDEECDCDPCKEARS